MRELWCPVARKRLKAVWRRWQKWEHEVGILTSTGHKFGS
jgi:hypothetical protein